ncbi:MAG: 30S ribosome-binding factor RbfA [Candidatus Zipacnadales bacterium]
MRTQRQIRVARRLREEIARILLREADDPLLRQVTITDVEVASDLKFARVFFSVLGPDPEAVRNALKGLRRARKFVQQRLADEGELRYTPTLDFRYDPTAERAQRIEEILRRLAEEGSLKREGEAEEEKPAEFKSAEVPPDNEADADFTP